MEKKNASPGVGSNRRPLDSSIFNFSVCARNDSKFWIGNRGVINMINLTIKMVPNLAKFREKRFFRSNCARNSTRRGLSDSKFHGEYESDQKKLIFKIRQFQTFAVTENSLNCLKWPEKRPDIWKPCMKFHFLRSKKLKKIAKC